MNTISCLIRRASIAVLSSLKMVTYIIGFACLSSVSLAQVTVEPVTGGYLVRLPAAAIERTSFDKLGTVPVVLNLSDPRLGNTKVSGPLQRTFKNSLLVKTTGKLSYLPTSETLVTLIRPEVPGFPPCSNIDEAPFIGLCTITHCPTVITCGSEPGTCQCLD